MCPFGWSAGPSQMWPECRMFSLAAQRHLCTCTWVSYVTTIAVACVRMRTGLLWHE